ncbi:MAG TPA: sialate O-acetylesterase [Chitinophagaceae bacterium]|nr:sialate O-acetylesterase [Chitinophagaceae bacterium]
MKACRLIALFLLMATCATAQPVSPDPGFDIYILMGQSNMAGRGALTDSLRMMGNEQVLVLNQQRQWVTAHHPLHFDKPAIAGVGPGLAFGLAMQPAAGGHRIGLVPCAVGGTPIEHWQPGAYDSATRTHPWDDAVARITYAMQYGVIKGVLWHQGEANSKPAQATQYLLQLTELVKRTRTLVQNPRLPFVAGELGYFYGPHDAINQQLALFPKLVDGTATVSAEGLTDKGDKLHFSAEAANELGKRYAAAMLQLLNH